MTWVKNATTKLTIMSIKIGIGKLRIGVGGSQSWESYWATREPTALTLVVYSDTQINTTWTDGAAAADGVKVYYSSDGGINYTLGDTVAFGVQAANITGLTANTEYLFKVVAYKGTNESTGDTDTATTIPAPLLDAYGSAAAAYSLRKLRTAYAGSCIKIRRSTDDATEDIGFSGGFIDESALTTFIGAASGYIDTWYDQSGNGLDIANTTTAQQPLLVLNGTVLKYNNRPYVSFNGTSDYLFRNTVSQFKNIGYIELYSVQRHRSVPTSLEVSDLILTGVPGSGARLAVGAGYASGKYFVGGRRADADTQSLNSSSSDVTESQVQLSVIAKYTSSALVCDVNGVNEINNTDFLTDGVTSNTDSNKITMGSFHSTTIPSAWSDIDKFENIWYNSDQSANKTAIEANQNAFFLTNQTVAEETIDYPSTIET